MRTPQRRPSKYTGLKLDPNITRAKFDELKNKLEVLKNIKQPREIIEVKRLAADGDFSENAAYQIAKGRLRGINQRILDIENHLKNAIIINPRTNTDTVQLGSHVTVRFNDTEKTFLILGPSETDPTRNVISHLSPIGAALLNHKVGDTVNIQLAAREVSYKIIKIE